METEARPQNVLGDAHDNVRCHVVGVVPAPERQVRNVGGVERATYQCPDAHEGLLMGFRIVWIIEAKDSYWSVVETVEDTGARGEVICAFGDHKVSSVEDDAGDPRCAAKVSKEKIVFPKRIGGRYSLADLG